MEICIVTGLEKDIQTKIEIAGLLNHIFNKGKYFRLGFICPMKINV